jgi:hypothetical protein
MGQVSEERQVLCELYHLCAEIRAHTSACSFFRLSTSLFVDSNNATIEDREFSVCLSLDVRRFVISSFSRKIAWS